MPRSWSLLLLALSSAACAHTPAPSNTEAPAEGADEGGTAGEETGFPPPAQTADLVLRGVLLAGSDTPVSLRFGGGRITAVGPTAGSGVDEAGATVIEGSGRWLVPAFIDSHVHLAYLPAVAEMAAGGVAAAVDLAAPEAFLALDHAPMQIIAAGPMVTAEGGYPTESWGRDGYGLECAGEAEAVAAVDHLFAAGAGVIKLPINGSPGLDEGAVTAAVARAHEHGLKVASHAMGESSAALAGRAGVDLLAHTPVEALSEATVAAFAGRAVVGTLAAFGGGAPAADNLRRLRDAGATVLYGTDFGNIRTPGIYESEIGALEDAGFTAAEILTMGTSAPAAYWGLSELGGLAVGQRASFLLLRADPLTWPRGLADPERVWIDGVEQGG